MPLPREHLLDELATAYIQAMIAVAGATISVSRRDYGVDGTIEHIATTADDGFFETGYPVDFQLKGTTLATNIAGTIKYDLRARNYNLIVGRQQLATPYYLFLVCFSPDTEKWAIANPDSLILNASEFWWTGSGLRSMNATSVRIEIPETNRLTFGAIEDMMGASEERFAT